MTILTTSLTKSTESPIYAQIQVNRLPLRLRTKPWLHFKLKKVTFELVLVFFLGPRFWRFWNPSDRNKKVTRGIFEKYFFFLLEKKKFCMVGAFAFTYTDLAEQA